MSLKIIKKTKNLLFLLFLSLIVLLYKFSLSKLHLKFDKHRFLYIKSKNILIEKEYLPKVKHLEEKTPELSDEIIILFTNDVHCAIMDNIGYDGLFLFKEELKKEYKTVLIADAGDAIQGGIVGILSKGMDIIKIMNLIEYDIAILGNHEFDYGLEQLNNITKELKNGYICANCCYKKNKTSILPPYKIITTSNNIKIAFIGVITPQTFSKTTLHSITDSEENPIYDFLIENNGTELYETIQNYINEVKMKGANYVIIVAHLGNDGDSLQKYTTDNLIYHLTGVDLLLDGHSHLVYNTFSEDKNGNFIPIMQTGTKLNNIGMVRIKNNGEIITKIISEIPKPLNNENAEYINRKNKMRWVDSSIKNKLNEIIHQYDEKLNEKIGYVGFDMLIDKKNLDENILCNLIADAIKYIGNSDISITNSGNIRNNLIKGNITYKNIIDILPFYNDLVIKEIKGKDILDALEFGSKHLPFNSQRFPQVSGIVYEVDTIIESSVEVDDNEIFKGIKGKRRVRDVMINGEELNLEKLYKVCLPYFIAKGGDGYSMFSKYDISLNPPLTDTEAVIIYIKTIFNGTIPNFYSKKQGRILINSEEKFDLFVNKLYKNLY